MGVLPEAWEIRGEAKNLLAGVYVQTFAIAFALVLVALLDLGELPELGGEIGRSNLQDGTRLSAETSRRLSCDCSLVPVTRGEQGEVLNVGRKRRTIPPALRRALEIRDGGCRFPGCGARICDSHHIVHWEDGGETCLDNLLLLCRVHHRAVHEEGFSVRMLSDGTLRFLDRVGWPLPNFAPPPELEEDPVEALIRQNQARGVDPDGSACSSRYERSADIPWSLEAGVWEALDPS